MFFVEAILSFSDPITDILTLVEFYRADHKTWFDVGLTFVPFSAAIARLEAFIYEKYGGVRMKSTALNQIDFAMLFEAVLEFASQFKIQFSVVRHQCLGRTSCHYPSHFSHRQLQVAGYCRVNVSFLCGNNSDCYSEERQSSL